MLNVTCVLIGLANWSHASGSGEHVHYVWVQDEASISGGDLARDHCELAKFLSVNFLTAEGDSPPRSCYLLSLSQGRVSRPLRRPFLEGHVMPGSLEDLRIYHLRRPASEGVPTDVRLICASAVSAGTARSKQAEIAIANQTLTRASGIDLK